jgi:hypothetical protein
MTLRISPIIPTLAALAGACSFSAEADIPEVDVTQHGVTIPGVPRAKGTGDVWVTSSFTFSSSNTAWAKRMNSAIYVSQATVAATAGVPNLDFIKSVHLTMADFADSEATTEIVSYDRCDQAPSSSVIAVSMPTPIDITTLWSADQTVIELAVDGQLPEQDWTVDVALKLTGKITYNY